MVLLTSEEKYHPLAARNVLLSFSDLSTGDDTVGQAVSQSYEVGTVIRTRHGRLGRNVPGRGFTLSEKYVACM
jgi:hypothetical protein